MEPESELDAALIDAFDAEPTPPRVLVTANESRRKTPPGDARVFRHAETAVAPVAAPQSSCLRHYPSLDALDAPPIASNEAAGTAAVPTDEEIEHQRRQLQAEILRFQQQASYMALALAGETPHQKEARRLREEERREREDRRLAAVEGRIEHMIEREHQREARQEERRRRHMERAHRASVSPSPERASEEEPVQDVETIPQTRVS